MMKINRHPSQKDLLWFGWLLPVFVAVVGTILRWQWKLPIAAWVVWIVGTVLVLLFTFAPALRRHLYVGWMTAAFPIGWLISHAVLGMVFYLVLTPIGLLMRLMGRDPMHRQFNPQAKSYWIARPKNVDVSRYFRQF